MVSPSLIGKRIYIDTSALIYAVEAPQLYPGLRSKVFIPFAMGQLSLVTSWITLSEVLVRPRQLGDSTLEMTYQSFLQPSPVFEILPVDQLIADQAANLRATLGVKLPDAIHIASGMSAGCTHFLTGDAKWSRLGPHVILAANL